jgi:hypothetical protein
MKGNLAFPHVVKDLTSPGGVLLYFAAAREPGKPYGGIHHARSKDGRQWHYGGVSHDGSGLDPLVMVSSERRYELYYTRRDASGQFLLMHARSADGRLFDEPNALLTFPAKGRGLYTLSGLHVDRRFLLFIESSTPAGRHDTLLWIRDEDGFEPFEGNPLIVDRDWIPRWDATRYGFNFVTHGDRTLLFYNGIAQRGAEEGGQIGLAEFDLARLKRMMK